jgi:carboxyl-terminal processing protease
VLTDVANDLVARCVILEQVEAFNRVLTPKVGPALGVKSMKIRHLICTSFVTALVAISFITPYRGIAAEPSPDAVAKADAEKKAEKKKESDEYYELLRLFADTLDQVERNYVKDVSRRELMEAAIRGMLGKLDQYSNYIPPDEIERFRGSVESEFGGVGIQVSIKDGYPTVISPIYGSPAYKAGLLAGDKIIKIAGKSSKDITIEEAVRLMKGKVGTKVKVSVKHVDDTKEEFELERAIVRVATVLGDHRTDDDTWEYMYDAEMKIGYIRISGFSRHTTKELRSAVELLVGSGLKGLVLDLRFNPGGLLSSAIEVSDMFLEEGRIVSTEGRSIPKRVWDAHKEKTFSGFPIAILVNKYSASASEIVSACLQDHKRAVVIGQRSWGKGSVQNIIDLEGGKSALKLTTAGYFRPSGKNIHKFKGATEKDEWGVKPNDGFEIVLDDIQTSKLLHARQQKDIVKDRTMGEEPEKFDDPQLAKALEYLEEFKPDEVPKSDKSDAVQSAKAND